MKRLLFVDHTPFAGGAQLVLAEHIAAIDKQVFEVHVACTTTVPLLVERYKQAGAQVHILPMAQLKRRHVGAFISLFTAVMGLRSLLIARRIDLVIANTTRASYICTLAVFGTRIPLIWWVRDFLYQRQLFNLLRGVPINVICVSQAIKQHYMAADDPKGVVIYVANSLYTRLASITPAMRQHERERWGISTKDVVVGFMGRLVAEKGAQDLVAAMVLLRNEGVSVKALIVGTGKNQAHDVEDLLRQEVTQQHLDDQVIMTGYQSDEALYYSIFDIFTLLTRDGEPFATTVVQAMMAGKPVIATNNGGTSELVKDGETGLLVDSNSPTEIAEAIRRLVKDGSFAKQLAQTGKDRVLQYHREETVTRQLEALYLDALST